MARTHSGEKPLKLHEAMQKIAEQQLEIARLHKVLVQTRRMQATSKYAVSIIAGFGRDWRSGVGHPVLSVPSHELFHVNEDVKLSA